MSTTALPHQPAAPWIDAKKFLWLLSPALPIIALGLLVLSAYTGWSLLLWGGPILLYVLIPLADWLVGEDSSNPPESAVAALEEARYYRFIVFAYIPSQFALTIFGAWLVASGRYDTWGLLGLIFTVGIVNGIAINTAHELGHKKDGLERWLAKLTLAPVAYGHFFVEHNKGHHKNVATPLDPASSRMGETFWAFLPRTVLGSLRSAWRIEKERLARRGQGPWTLANENIQAWLMTLALFGLITAWLGWMVLPFLILQAAFGASMLEVINYIEHYGLLRQQDASGRYERCSPAHSWNSNHVVTNLFLYQLQRHSDHHANPTRRFQALRHFDDSPQLPSGYASMLLLAYLPPLWFRQMDPLVVRHYGGDLGRAHLHAPRREQLLARWQQAPLDDGKPAHYPRELDMAGAPQPASSRRHQCTDCGFIYDEEQGCEAEGFAPGTPWDAIPDDWACPDCAVRDKVDFRPI